jgi:fructose-bisphosphate aldolase class I
MNSEKYEVVKNNSGFIAALDQSGGSTANALKLYGIDKDKYNTEEEMFNLVHSMRSRIIKSNSFSSEHIIGVILFKKTMDSMIDGEYTADYLWNHKKIVSFLKIDNGLDVLSNGVQLMKPMPELDDLLNLALKRNIFGTKMRSVIKEYNEEGIKLVVNQQFKIAKQIFAKGLVPIIEPEVDINAVNKEKCEELLKIEINKHLEKIDPNMKIMFKFTIPVNDNFYEEYTNHPNVVRVVALSGGYSRDIANEKLMRNRGVIASFSRALLEGLNVNQTEEEFDSYLLSSIKSIYEASK